MTPGPRGTAMLACAVRTRKGLSAACAVRTRKGLSAATTEPGQAEWGRHTCDNDSIQGLGRTSWWLS